MIQAENVRFIPAQGRHMRVELKAGDTIMVGELTDDVTRQLIDAQQRHAMHLKAATARLQRIMNLPANRRERRKASRQKTDPH